MNRFIPIFGILILLGFCAGMLYIMKHSFEESNKMFDQKLGRSDCYPVSLGTSSRSALSDNKTLIICEEKARD